MQHIGQIVSTSWLSKVLAPGSKSLRVLDTIYGNGPKEVYKNSHIPEALPFDIYKCSDEASPYTTMLPTPEQFADYVGDLGIDNDTHVILYDANPMVGMFASPRVWWMFRIFGHPKVSVLDGGLTKWVNEGHPISDMMPYVEEAEFKADFQPRFLKNYQDMVSNAENAHFQVMDARPVQRFMGEAPEPGEDVPLGHMPNSVNIPFTAVFNQDTTLKSPEELTKVFKEANIDLHKPLTASCGMGITACVLSLAACVAGKKDVSVYDGSWEEYAQRVHPDLILSSAKGGQTGG